MIQFWLYVSVGQATFVKPAIILWRKRQGSRRMLWIWKLMQWQQPACQSTWILFAISSLRTTQMQVHLWIGRKTSTRENSILKRKSWEGFIEYKITGDGLFYTFISQRCFLCALALSCCAAAQLASRCDLTLKETGNAGNSMRKLICSWRPTEYLNMQTNRADVFPECGFKE